MQQLNDHTSMINQVKAQYLREEETQIAKTAETEVDRQAESVMNKYMQIQK